MSEKITEGTAFGTNYTVHAKFGSVKNTETRTETEVTGSVSGGGGVTMGGV